MACSVFFFFLYQNKFQEDRGGIFILYRLCKRKQFEDRFELEFKPLPITDSETVANRLALVLILDVICSLGLIPFTAVMRADTRQEGGSAQCLGMADLQMLTPTPPGDIRGPFMLSVLFSLLFIIQSSTPMVTL